MEFTNHELGPAIIFQHFPSAIRLDHFLIQKKDQISDHLRLISYVRSPNNPFAHEKNIVHRTLGPRSILIVNPDTNPQAVIMDWQLGYRRASAGETIITHPVTSPSTSNDWRRNQAKFSWPLRFSLIRKP